MNKKDRIKELIKILNEKKNENTYTIKNPNITAYFTFNINNIIVTTIPTTKASNT